MSLYTIVPTYNESENITKLLAKVAEVYKQNSIQGGVIVVDDGSPDGTGNLVKQAAVELSSKNFEISLIERSGKLGLGSAYIAGFKAALANKADYILEMDADFSHNPEYIPSFLLMLKDSDVVIGSRYIAGGGVANWPKSRILISRSGSIYSKLILGWGIADATGGFNAWSRKVLEKIDLDSVRSNGYAFQIELKYRALQKGFKLSELPIIFVDRELGTSKMSRKIVTEALQQVLRMRFGR